MLSRKEDPLPQALRALTPYDMDAVNRMDAVSSSDELHALLREEPETFADHLLLGLLTYASPLGLALVEGLVKYDSAPDEVLAGRRANMLALVALHAAWNSRLIETSLLLCYEEGEDRDEATEERAGHRAGLEAAFGEWGHSLGHLLAAPAPVLPPDPGPGWSIMPARLQLDTLAMATTVLRELPRLSRHPFAGAVAHLPDYHPQRLQELGEYLSAAEEKEYLPFTRTQGLLLYLTAHVVGIMFVSDVLDGEGLDDVLLRRQLAAKPEDGDEDEDEATTADLIARLREVAAIVLGSYINVVRGHEGDAPDFQALEARLGPVLALAVA